MRKKTLALALALVMCLTLLPMGAMAVTVEEVLPPTLEYDRVGALSEGLAWVQIKSNTNPGNDVKCGYIDEAGKVVIPLEYSYADDFQEGLALVKKDGKLSFIDKTGKTVIPIEYGNARSFSEGLAAVEKDGKWGFINKIGETVIPFEYSWIESGFNDGLAIVGAEGDQFFIDTTGKIAFQLDKALQGRYILCPFSEGLAQVTDMSKEKHGYIDKTGKVVIPIELDMQSVDSRFDFKNGLATALKYGPGDGIHGYINKDGEFVIANQYVYAGPFSEGLAVVRKSWEGKYGVIDTKGNVVIPFEYEQMSRFHGGVAIVETKNGLALIDKTGKLLTDDSYTSGTFTDEGMVTVQKDGKWGILRISDNGLTPPVTPTPTTVTAISSAQKVTVNGKDVAFDAYNINGNNYFKLRDLAFALSGSEKQFDVGWD
ncbi:MAG: WG repeat-containing protein, partial [Acidaminococcaceae bacterium]